MAYFIKDTYLLDKVATLNGNETISFDESLFTHENNAQTLVVGNH